MFGNLFKRGHRRVRRLHGRAGPMLTMVQRDIAQQHQALRQIGLTPLEVQIPRRLADELLRHVRVPPTELYGLPVRYTHDDRGATAVVVARLGPARRTLVTGGGRVACAPYGDTVNGGLS